MSNKTIKLQVQNIFCMGLEYLIQQTDTSYFRTYWESKHCLNDKKLLSNARHKDTDI